ncbi:MAG: hypothetical protein RIQ60_62 [Pseudomonadota bacterium]
MLAPPTLHAAEPGSSTPTVEARVIVQFKAGSTLLGGRVQALSATHRVAPLALASALSARAGLALSDGHTVTAQAQVMTASGLSSEALASRLAQLDDVEFAVPDRRRHALAVPNDPLYANPPAGTTPAAGQWYLRPPTATLVSAVDAEGAWAITSGQATVVVAMLDTGVRFDHPDLQAKLLAGYDFISDARTAADGNGRDPDPSDPGNWITAADVTAGTYGTDCQESKSSWHGTKTAGLVGASTNNSLGMAGLGRDVRVLPVRVLGKCGGFDSDIIAAMLWASGIHVDGVPDNTAHPAQVVNLSLGSAGSCSTDSSNSNAGNAILYRQAIDQLAARGVVVVAAAGNDQSAVNMPANCPGVIAVGGLGHAGTKSGFASLGQEVTLSAPAGDDCGRLAGPCLYPILSTTNAGLQGPQSYTGSGDYTTGGTDASFGTSFAAPLVSATAALLLSQNASLTASQVRTLLRRTTVAFPTVGSGLAACAAPNSVGQTECLCNGATCGSGMLSAKRALNAVVSPNPLADIQASALTVPANQTVQLDANGSWPGAGRSFAGGFASWRVKNGTGITTLSTGGVGLASLSFSGRGAVTVTLTVTNTLGVSASVDQDISVIDAVSTPTASAKSGGGALVGGPGLLWIGLLPAVVALARVRRQPRR